MTKDGESLDWRGLPIKRPYPWEIDVTVCIAAPCLEGKGSRIVVCADRKASSALGSAESTLKMRALPSGWHALVSGNESDIEALIRHFRNQFGTLPGFEEIDACIKQALFARKRELAEEYVQSRFAITYAEFYATGKERLPADVFHNAIQGISTIDLGAELIICGFISGFPEIYHCDRRGKATAASDFSVIGEGEYLAAASLLRREQHHMESLGHTLYNVFEAKRYAQAVGSVGAKTLLAVLEDGKKSHFCAIGIHEQLDAYLNQYGPKETPQTFGFNGPLYHEQKEQAQTIISETDREKA